MKRTTLGGTAVLALVMAMLLTGCPTATNGGGSGGGGGDTLTNITSLSQIEGTWKGALTETLTEGDDYDGNTIPQGLIVTITIEKTSVFNANTAIAKYTSKTTVVLSKVPGSSLDLATVWTQFKTFFPNTYPNAAFDDATYTATDTETGTASITLADLSGAQINQTGTKFKWPGDDILYTKQ